MPPVSTLGTASQLAHLVCSSGDATVPSEYGVHGGTKDLPQSQLCCHTFTRICVEQGEKPRRVDECSILGSFVSLRNE